MGVCMGLGMGGFFCSAPHSSMRFPQRARQDLQDKGCAASGVLSIGLSPSISRSLTAPLVDALRTQFPRATISVAEGLSTDTAVAQPVSRVRILAGMRSHPPADSVFDIAIVGAGIAGVSLAYFAAGHATVLLLEREAQPAMHSTGRSAAMFMESYGSPQVRALTRASRPFFTAPPAGFSALPLLSPRGALYIGRAEQTTALRLLHASLCAEGCPAELLDTRQALARVPVLRPEAAALAVFDPLAADLDVHALHQGYLRGARQQGAWLKCDAEVECAVRVGGREGARDGQRDGQHEGQHEGQHGEQHARSHWRIDSSAGRFQARCLVNAAGAWVDELAARAGVAPIGIQPRRRSAFVFDGPPGVATAHWPCVASAEEDFYFKPEAGLLLGSPANADPVPPHDVLPEELDIATGIARIEAATTLSIRRPRRTWAGLRSFVDGGDLVGGFDPQAEGFFWVAAQGGYGIQTSAAMGALCAARLLGHEPPAWVADALPYWDSLSLRTRRPA